MYKHLYKKFKTSPGCEKMHEIWADVFSYDSDIVKSIKQDNVNSRLSPNNPTLCITMDTQAHSSQSLAELYRDNKPRNYKKNRADVKRKRLKNEGKEFLSKRGDIVKARAIGEPCDCTLKCSVKFPLAERMDLFNKFWELGDIEKQWQYVLKYTTKLKKKRTRPGILKLNRQFTYKYYFPCNSTQVNVCRTMFLNTYSISETLIKTAWDKFDGNTLVKKDMRGKHKNHKRTIDDEMIKSVCDHVDTFIPVDSQHNGPKILYLGSGLSVSRMFNLYKEWSGLSNYSNNAFTIRQYRDIVSNIYEIKRNEKK
ncbi:uncharacterized protein LOC112050230 [Bicyclus anynana]|uniref:Uncharacterized protein LOC112050230 n=1 Tax=Bicyclus anynana TaxID=110368 RepID=A0ABM3LLK3_BICAN|nr:uncharacterized protein LOC112050230 [Bicyclus anynana]